MHNLKTNLKRALPKKSIDRLKCSFCGKSADAVNKLIAGPKGICICDACIGKCSDILSQDAAGTLKLPAEHFTSTIKCSGKAAKI